MFMTNQLKLTGLAMTAGVGAKEFNNIYAQWGALGILLLILIWYGYSSYKENQRRDKQMIEERKLLVESHASEKQEMIERHVEEKNKADERYHELHLELLAFLKSYTQVKKTNTD